MREIGRYNPGTETSRQRATRKWRNNVVRANFLEKRQKEKVDKIANVNKEPEIAETVINEGRRSGPIKRLESKFKREIKAMLRGQVDKNLMLYAGYLAHLKNRLLREKLRRLQAAQLKPHSDLFGGQ
jgi:hypothetical protein